MEIFITAMFVIFSVVLYIAEFPFLSGVLATACAFMCFLCWLQHSDSEFK